MSAARSAVPVGNASAPSVAYDHATTATSRAPSARSASFATSASATTGARCARASAGGRRMARVQTLVHSARGHMSRTLDSSAFRRGGTSDVVSSRPSSSAPTIAASELSAAETCTALSRPQWWVTSSESSAGLPARLRAAVSTRSGLHEHPRHTHVEHPQGSPLAHPHDPSAPPRTNRLPRGLRALPFSAGPGAQHDAMMKERGDGVGEGGAGRYGATAVGAASRASNDPFSVRSQKSAAAQRLLRIVTVVVGSVPPAPLPFARPSTSI